MEYVLALLASLSGIAVGIFLVSRYVRRGTKFPASVSDSIDCVREGLASYFRWQLHPFITYFFIILLVLLLIYYSVHGFFAWRVLISFAGGVLLTAAAVYYSSFLSLYTQFHSMDSNNRHSLFRQLYSGSVAVSLMAVSLVFAGAVGVLVFCGVIYLIQYVLGSCFVAVFSQINGGIFSKSFEISSDIIRHEYPTLAENDRRNPSFWGERTGVCVADVAGRVSSMITWYLFGFLGVLLIILRTSDYFNLTSAFTELLMSYPVLLYSAGLMAVIGGMALALIIRPETPLRNMIRGVYVSIAALGLMTLVINLVLPVAPIASFIKNPYVIFVAVLLGLIGTAISSFVSEYYGSGAYAPVKIIAGKSQYSPVNTILDGIRHGMKSLFFPVVAILVVLHVSYQLLGYFGIGMSAIGALSIAGIVLGGYVFSANTQNIKGIVSAGPTPANMQDIVRLDSDGDVAQSISLGYASIVSVLSSLVVLLPLAGYFIERFSIRFDFVAAFAVAGAFVPYFFSYFIIKGISETSMRAYEESNAQLTHVPYLLKGKTMPDVGRIVRVVIRKAQRYTFVPVALALVLPYGIGSFIGKDILFVFLLGALVSGLLVALIFSNTGGLLHTAKKYIEAGNFGGTGTPTYQHAKVGDMIGTPLKDAIGPSIDILIKIMLIFSLIVFPVL